MAQLTGRVAQQLDYESALRLVMGLVDFERSIRSPKHSSFHLERVRLLLERLGSPHLETPTVHIAGTNGKGSTAAMVTSILTAEGYRTGLYTSPHLHSTVERIRTGLDPVTPQTFAALVEQVWPSVQEVGESSSFGSLTFFEVLTAMAFLHFKQTGCDFQVIEVGLGGRLDATNVVHPNVCAITHISLDHTATLGETVPLIAAEKSGIVKPGVPVVVAPQDAEALAVIRGVAADRNADVIEVGRDVRFSRSQTNGDCQPIVVEGRLETYSACLPLLGEHQVENAATAVATAETLAAGGHALSGQSITDGLSGVRWPARLQRLNVGGKQLIADGAHNPESMRRLVDAATNLFDFDRVIMVFGVLGGHSAEEMLAQAARLSPLIVAVRSREPRAKPSEVIAQSALEQALPVAFKSDHVGEATRRALEMAGERDLVIGAGSLSVAAEVIEEIDGMTPELYPYLEQPSGRPESKRDKHA